MIPRVLYLVSSHASYKAPLKRILKSLGGLPTMVVTGGCKERRVLDASPDKIVVETDHNSFDYTALIELMRVFETMEKGLLPDHIFLLQDTMELGARTDELVKQANIHACATAAFGGQCNLCLFRLDYLLAHRDFILSLRDCDKGRAVEAEGKLWRDAPEDRRLSFENATCEVVGEGKPYRGARRIREYYAGVDITKWKANYGQGGGWIEKP